MDQIDASHQVGGKVIHEEIIPAREFTSFSMNRGQVLRITDLEGRQVADLGLFQSRRSDRKAPQCRGVRLKQRGF